MKANDAVQYISDAEKAGKMPEVTLGGRRFFVTLEEAEGRQYAVLSMPLEIGTDGTLWAWREYSTRDGELLKPIPINELDTITPPRRKF